MHQTVTFEASYWVKLWKWTAYNKIIQNFENGGRIFTHSPNQNNAKCTYFHPKMYLRGQKMYLVNNVLENQIWAVPLLLSYSNHCQTPLPCLDPDDLLRDDVSWPPWPAASALPSPASTANVNVFPLQWPGLITSTSSHTQIVTSGEIYVENGHFRGNCK